MGSAEGVNGLNIAAATDSRVARIMVQILIRVEFVVALHGKPRHVGKESNKLEERLSHGGGTEAEYLNVAGPEEWSDFRQVVVPMGIALHDTKAIAAAAGLSRRVVQKALSLGPVSKRTQRALQHAIDELRLSKDREQQSSRQDP